MVRKPKTEYYVNNKEFLEALVAYKFRVNRAKDAGESRPIVPNYVGECFLKIATHLSYKPNFVNYMFREDMICYGIENCLQYIDNFNPEKSSNPFAYFTQIIYYAFLRRIQKEKRQLEIKSKILEKSGHQEIMHTDTYDGDMAGMNASYSDMGSIKENIETRMNR
jgi:DNA-directed RNA polymerase specialized sigma24 family protein